MLGTNLGLPATLTSQLIPITGGTQAAAAPTEKAQAPLTAFDQLLQALSGADPSPESALPELVAVVASLAESSNLIEGIEKPVGSAETPKQKEPPAEHGPPQGDPLAALQALLGMVPQTCPPKEEAPVTAELSKPSQAQPVIDLEDLELETPKLEAPEKPVLNLKDFDVRRFEFKTEVEVAVVQPKLIRVTTFPELMQGQIKSNLTQPKPVKGSVDPEVTDAAQAAPAVFSGKHEAPLIKAPEAVQRVHVAIDPPPPPPVARQISMDIGDPESQVRVVIRERNGDLAVQFGAATERLRDNLQTAAPLLMHELRRDNPHSVSLDFSRFGTATEGGHESHQDSRPKKQLKPEAVFADVDETAYLTNDTSSAKPF